MFTVALRGLLRERGNPMSREKIDRANDYVKLVSLVAGLIGSALGLASYFEGRILGKYPQPTQRPPEQKTATVTDLPSASTAH
jgi:hypothetical protein